MSSSLQCLFHTKELVQYFLNVDDQLDLKSSKNYIYNSSSPSLQFNNNQCTKIKEISTNYSNNNIYHNASDLDSAEGKKLFVIDVNMDLEQDRKRWISGISNLNIQNDEFPRENLLLFNSCQTLEEVMDIKLRYSEELNFSIIDERLVKYEVEEDTKKAYEENHVTILNNGFASIREMDVEMVSSKEDQYSRRELNFSIIDERLVKYEAEEDTKKAYEENHVTILNNDFASIREMDVEMVSSKEDQYSRIELNFSIIDERLVKYEAEEDTKKAYEENHVTILNNGLASIREMDILEKNNILLVESPSKKKQANDDLSFKITIDEDSHNLKLSNCISSFNKSNTKNYNSNINSTRKSKSKYMNMHSGNNLNLMAINSRAKRKENSLERENKKNKEKENLLTSFTQKFKQLIIKMWSTTKTPSFINPKNFRESLIRLNPQFDNYSQQDAHELLTFILESLHLKLSRGEIQVNLDDYKNRNIKSDLQSNNPEKGENCNFNKSKNILNWKDHFLMNNSAINEFFYGQLVSSLTCHKCRCTSLTYEPFNNLGLSIPNEFYAQIYFICQTDKFFTCIRKSALEAADKSSKNPNYFYEATKLELKINDNMHFRNLLDLVSQSLNYKIDSGAFYAVLDNELLRIIDLDESCSELIGGNYFIFLTETISLKDFLLSENNELQSSKILTDSPIAQTKLRKSSVEYKLEKQEDRNLRNKNMSLIMNKCIYSKSNKATNKIFMSFNFHSFQKNKFNPKSKMKAFSYPRVLNFLSDENPIFLFFAVLKIYSFAKDLYERKVSQSFFYNKSRVSSTSTRKCGTSVSLYSNENYFQSEKQNAAERNSESGKGINKTQTAFNISDRDIDTFIREICDAKTFVFCTKAVLLDKGNIYFTKYNTQQKFNKFEAESFRPVNLELRANQLGKTRNNKSEASSYQPRNLKRKAKRQANMRNTILYNRNKSNNPYFDITNNKVVARSRVCKENKKKINTISRSKKNRCTTKIKNKMLKIHNSKGLQQRRNHPENNMTNTTNQVGENFINIDNDNGLKLSGVYICLFCNSTDSYFFNCDCINDFIIRNRLYFQSYRCTSKFITEKQYETSFSLVEPLDFGKIRINFLQNFLVYNKQNENKKTRNVTDFYAEISIFAVNYYTKDFFQEVNSFEGLCHKSQEEISLSIYDLIDYFTIEEKLPEENYSCETCSEYVFRFKKFEINSFPKILIVYFKRFRYDKQLPCKARNCYRRAIPKKTSRVTNDSNSKRLQKSNCSTRSNKDASRTAKYAIYFADCNSNSNYLDKTHNNNKKNSLIKTKNTFLETDSGFCYDSFNFYSNNAAGKNEEGEKNMNKIDFPFKLNLTKYNRYGETTLYELYAVCNHEGNTTEGHYKAVCKDLYTNNWFEYDDKKVKQIREESIVSNQAYILFYRKISDN